nr:ribonuclease H-like domain-containing protein [Tanacetum cinerariifolium]
MCQARYSNPQEVILNGDSPALTRVIEGVVQPIAPTTTKKRLARKNELKAHGTLLMALPDKHQLKFNIHKDAKTIMEAIEKRFGGNKETKKTHTLIWRNKINLEEQSLDDLFNNLKIYEAEVKSSSSASTSTQNIAFVSSQTTDSTNEQVSAVAIVSAASAKSPVSALPNRTRRNLKENGPTSMGFDMLKVECYNCHRKGHFERECSYDWSFRAEEEPTNYSLMSFTSSRLEYVEARLLVYQQNEFVFEEDIKLLKLEVQLRDNALVVLRQNFEKVKQARDYLKLKLEKFLTSSKNLSQLLASQTNDKNELGYNTQVFTSSMFDCDEMFCSETDESLPASPIYDSLTKHDKDLSHTHRPSTPIIEDWVSDSEDDSEVEIPQNTPSFVQPIEQVKTPRPSVQTIETSIPAANHKTAFLKPKSHRTIRNGKACFVCKSLTHLIKDCDYYEKKMAQILVRNHAQRGNHQ